MKDNQQKQKEKKVKPKKPIFEKMNKEYWATFRFYDSKGRRLSIFARPSKVDYSIIVTVLKLSKEPNMAPGDPQYGPYTGPSDRFEKVTAKALYEKEHLSSSIMGKKSGTDYSVPLQEGETIPKALVRWARETFYVQVPKQITVFEYHKAKNLPKPEKKKDRFTVFLKNAGPNKLSVVKCVKDLTGFGLKESKELVDSAPKAIQINLDKKAATEFVAELISCGAAAEVK